MTFPYYYMGIVPRDYQRLAIDDAAAFLLGSSAGSRRLYASPTGTGKSIMELETLAKVPGSWLVTPRVEIMADLLVKLGYPESLSVDALSVRAWQRRITTPIRLRNALLVGELPPPRYLILDEAHHHSAETYQQIDALMPAAVSVGFTATPYRGSPSSTLSLRKQWGDPVWVLTMREAVDRGALSFPHCETVPILDDDRVTLTNGEFSVASINEATLAGGIPRAVILIRRFWDGSRFDRPTMVAVPSVMLQQTLTDALAASGMPSVGVIGATQWRDRREAFKATLDGSKCLVQISVVGEGVDLPVRRLIDMSPRMSPVAWLQQFGRITRPVNSGEDPPHYVCTNRNLLRHAYLLDGLLPYCALAESEALLGVSARAGGRAVGLEGLGRFAAAEVPFAGGVTGLVYALSRVEGCQVTEYCCLLHPLSPSPIWAEKRNSRTDSGTYYGKWVACEAPESLSGYASAPPAPVSEKQKAWWLKSAKGHGLSETATPNRKNFQALPVLTDLRLFFYER